MRFLETETVELKSIVMDDIKKEIIAFANCDGGTVYVGVADDGTVLGVKNADECALQISNMVRDSIKPDVAMFIHYETLDCAGKTVVAVNVQRGTNRPYYLAKKGLRPEGVYVRQGYSSVPATEHQAITRKEAQALLDVSQSTAGRILKAMVDSCQIKQFGGSRTTRYALPER